MFRELLLPSTSSQTTSVDIVTLADDATMTVSKNSMNAGSAEIQISRKKTWEQVMEDVLNDRATTWKELADL